MGMEKKCASKKGDGQWDPQKYEPLNDTFVE